MSLNRCAHCTALFSIGAEHCPQCGNADFYEEGSMPKIRREGGATYPITVEVAGPTQAVGGIVPEGSIAYVAEEGPEVVDLPAEAEAPEDEGPDGAPVGPYAGMLRPDLQAACAARGLASYGSKAELIARLTAADAAAAVDGEDSDPA